MKLTVRSLFLPMLVLSSLTVGVGIAYAHDASSDSEIVNFRYNDDKERFQGKVVSERERCEGNRIVQVFEKLPGNNRLVGDDGTNDSGFFKLDDKMPKGDYYAKVLRRLREREGHRHVCRGDRSEVITVTGDGGGPPENPPVVP